MPSTQEEIQRLVAYPRENLAVEIKDWFNTSSPEGQAKIVKTCVALRNQDGGSFLVGFENATWTPELTGVPTDVRSAWNADDIHAFVSRFASTPFEVHLQFGERDGQEFTVLQVEPGGRTPVASKREILDPANLGRRLVKMHAVYVRSLSANGTVSTTEARYDDWASLVRRCFDNLEADIGRFARRHLGGTTPETAQVLAEALGTVSKLIPEGPLPEIELENFMRYCYARLQTEQRQRDLIMLPQQGYWQASAIVEGNVPGGPPTRQFLNLISAANPSYTGWPLWIDSRGLSHDRDEPGGDPRPYTYEHGWEAFLYSYEENSWYNYLDFWRAEPAGRFYQYRALEDDLSEGSGHPEAMTALDFRMVIWRIAEAIAVPMAFAQAMKLSAEETVIWYEFRWSGLRGRELSSWTDPRRFVRPGYVCHQYEVSSPMIPVPLDTPTSAIGPFVQAATARLFAAFDGAEIPVAVIEELVEDLLSRNRSGDAFLG